MNYQREHLKDFTVLAAPIYDLTNSKSTFLWGEAQNNSFHSLRQSMSNPAILAFPKPDCLFILDTDASDHAVGAELSQVQNGREVLISYASKTLSATLRRYCVTRKELLAIVVFTRQFRFYLLGQPFIVRTDHHSLAWLLGFKNIKGQLARWWEELSQYNMTLQHCIGKAHCNADGLSRIPNLEPPCDCYDAGRNISDLPCGGCKYCQKIHNHWSRFGEDIDDVVPLAVREARTELSLEDPNPEEK